MIFLNLENEEISLGDAGCAEIGTGAESTEMLGDDEASPDDISSGNYTWKRSPCSSVSGDSLYIHNLPLTLAGQWQRLRLHIPSGLPWSQESRRTPL
jgi:hypothetical protein